MNKLLTPLELRVMNILWKIKHGFVKDILERWTEQPPPAYNTISTIIRILQEKGFIAYKAQGRSYEYYPTMSKLSYQKMLIFNVIESAFAGSASSLISTLVNDEHLSEAEIKELQSLLNAKVNTDEKNKE